MLIRPKSLILLALALGCGLVASIGISQVMERQAGNQAPQIEMEEIYVALADINVNEPLTEENVKLEKWPKEKIHPDAMKNLEEILNRRASTKIYAGDPIRAAKLIPIGGESATQTIPPGYRTVTVRVDAASGTPGLLKPGDRVDVQLFVKENPGLNINETKTQTILQDVKVFAVDQQYRRGSDGEEGANVARTISLLVTPKQANKVSLASRLGEIYLLPRHPDDKDLAQDAGFTSDELFGLEKSDREQESEGFADAQAAGSTIATGIASFLTKLKEKQAENEDSAPQRTVAAADPQKEAWKIVVVEGAQLREVEVFSDGRLPREVDGGIEPVPEPQVPQVPGSVPPTSADPAAPITSGGGPPTPEDDLQTPEDAQDLDLDLDLEDLDSIDDDLSFGNEG